MKYFTLTWDRLTATYADSQQRVYRGMIDSPRRQLEVRHFQRAAGRNRTLAHDATSAREVRPGMGGFPGHAQDALHADEGARSRRQTGGRSTRTYARRKSERLHAIAGRNQAAVNQLEKSLQVIQKIGAGDGDRTRDVQLGNRTVNWKQRTLRFRHLVLAIEIWAVFALCLRAALIGAQTEHEKALEDAREASCAAP